jgi:hypothetical protein
MRVLIQNCKTLKFYSTDGKWTSDCPQAKDFRGSVLALDFIRDNHLHHTQIILKFPREEMDVTLPSKDCAPAGASLTP